MKCSVYSHPSLMVWMAFFVLSLPVAANAGAGVNNAVTQQATKKVEEANKKAVEQEQKKRKAAEESGDENEASAQARPENTGPVFDIYEFRVLGNTKLSQKVIGKAVYPQMGKKKTIADVEAAREALEKAYHQAGYLTVIVDIPEQDVDNKIVKLNVTEGQVSKLRVSGSRYYSLGRIKALSSTVKEGEVPHFPTLQKQMTKLNRTADKRITPVIKAGRVFGTVDVDLKVEDQLPFHGSLEINDQFSRDTTRYRLAGSLSYDNLFQKDHSLSLSFLSSPEKIDESQVLSGNYLMRFDNSDMLLAMYAIWSNSEVATIGGINVLGDAKIFGVRAIKPLPGLDNYFHSFSFGFDYKDFGQDSFFGDAPLGESPISYMPLAASYSGTLQHDQSQTKLSAGLTLGVRGLFSDEEEFAAKRQGVAGENDPAKPNFTISKVELNHTHNLPKDFEFFGKLGGQFTGDMLISNEQFLAGGIGSVRGYLASDAQGDRAIHSTLELRSTHLFKSINWINEFKAHAFYDWTRLETIDPIDGESPSTILAGVGFGAYLKAWRHWNARLEFAWPLKDYLTTDAGDYRTHMRLWYEF